MSNTPCRTCGRRGAAIRGDMRTRGGVSGAGLGRRRPATLLVAATPLFLTATLLPIQVHGQAQPEDTVTLAPIVVSVLRSPVRLDRMPFSTSVIAGPDLTRGNTGLFIEEALHGLVGVRVQNRYNPSVGERISIRGFGARSQFGVRGIKILVDGIPATLPDGQSTLDHLDIGSLGRVEALRGPAASLYGNGAGGVILFESAEPYGGVYRQETTVVTGSDGALRLQATGSGTAGSISFRASAAQSRFDGFRTNETGSGEDPYSQATRTTLNAGFKAEAAGGLLALQFNGLELDALNAGSLPGDLFDQGSNQAWGFNVRRRTAKDVRQGQAGISWQGVVGGMEGTLSAYGVRRELDNPIPTSVIDLNRSGGGLRLALARHWAMPAGSARADFGVEGELQSDDRRNFANDGGERAALTLDQQERVRATAVFGKLHLPMSTRLGVVGALRFDHFSFSADDRFQGADNPDDSGTRTMTGLNPSLGLHLDLGDHGIFASVARSFETPTTTELANQPDRAGGFNPELEAQRGWTVEGGLRGDLAGRASYDVAVYSSALANQLVPFEVPSAPGRRFFRNAGQSRIQGFEASARTRVSSSVTARLSYGYVNARFTEFTVGGNDYADNSVPGIAPHRVEGSLRAARGPWYGEFRVEVRGEVPANNANDASADQYTLMEVRVGGSDIVWGNWTLSPFAAVTNLADARYASSVVVNAFGGRYFEPGPDRGGYLGLKVGWERVR